MFLSRTTCDSQEMTVDSDGCVDAFMISVTLLTICSAMCLPDGQVGRQDPGLLPHCVIGPLRGIISPAIGQVSFLLGCWIRTERWRTRTRCCVVNREVMGGKWRKLGLARKRRHQGWKRRRGSVCACVCERMRRYVSLTTKLFPECTVTIKTETLQVWTLGILLWTLGIEPNTFQQGDLASHYNIFHPTLSVCGSDPDSVTLSLTTL